MQKFPKGTRAAECGALIFIALVTACGTDPTQKSATDPIVTKPVVPIVTTQAGSAAPSVVPPTNTPPTNQGAAGMAGNPAVATTPNAISPWCGVKTTLDANCIACHNEQKTAGAPMSLKTYADLQAPAVTDKTKKVYQLVGLRVHDAAKPMPPQQKLTADALTGIDQWIAAGAPAGSDPTCGGGTTMATPPATAAWPSNCDAMYKLTASTPYMVPAGQEVHPKAQITAPWGNEDVQVIAWRSITDNPKVLHHWILYGPAGEFLIGWAPGKDTNEPLPPDVGIYMAGGSVTLDVHYNNLTGTKTEADQSGVEVCVLKKDHFRAQMATVTQGLSQFLINIPAHAVNFDVTGSCTFTGLQPATLLSASPHAHKYAHHMKFTVQRASGETVVMRDAAFDFTEQGVFELKPAVKLAQGDTITTTCTYTNPEDTPVTFGENTGNEMCFNFAMYYPMGSLNCGAGLSFPRN